MLTTKTQRIRNRQNFSHRKVVKRNSTHQLSTMTSPLSKPKQNLNPWTHPPVMNLMQAPTPPELTSYQEQVIREHRLMLKFLRSGSDSCEFACDSEEYSDKWGVGAGRLKNRFPTRNCTMSGVNSFAIFLYGGDCSSFGSLPATASIAQPEFQYPTKPPTQPHNGTRIRDPSSDIDAAAIAKT